MGYVMRRIETYPRSGEGWSAIATVLIEASYPEIAMGWGKIKDSFNFTLPKGTEYFDGSAEVEFENLVRIFLWRDSIAYNPQTDLVMEGVIKGTPQTLNDSGNLVTVQGFNFSEVFFDNQLPVNQVNKTWVEIVKQILLFVNGSGINSNAIRRVYWYPANPTAKNDSSAFAQKTLVTNYMTVSTLFDRLTGNEFTEDGQYVWYVQQYKAKLNGGINNSVTSMIVESIEDDPDGATPNISSELPDTGVAYIGTEKIKWTSKSGTTLTIQRGVDGTTAASHNDNDTVLITGQYHFKSAYKGGTASSTIVQNGSNVYEETSDINILKDRDETKNYVPCNCGTDLYGRAVETVAYDVASIGKIGYKYYYATEETQDIFLNIWNKERHRNPASFNPDSEGAPTSNFPTAYNYTFEDGTVVSSDEDFNETLREQSKVQGEKVANDLIRESKNPRYTISYTTRFNNSLTLGTLYDANFPSRSVNRKLRLLELHHNASGTQVYLDEDETTATVEG